ncbi:CdaR family protein [Inconstantimicrobium mannanitabidum]|uniref:Uncharacterized protein n=1 Tax=Inconstantimicrobium mannanitabidum TaxID=1604901 RepID=A0ACB5RIH1_9CLOT|nr:CdaR family protein [Clostridium sp. TW13]GKX68892.1 hypothetical protein rsdtw13_41500 [Clostridium sp. TW13]
MDNEEKKKNIAIKVICVLFSLGLWLYITNIENPIKEYKINNVPVEIINEDVLKDSNLTLMPNQTLKINVTIEGPATEVYKVSSDQIKVAVNLSGYALKKGENKIPVEIQSYPAGISIKNNDFLRVAVNLDTYAEKNLPIQNDINIKTKSGYYKGDIEVSPSTATISGAAQYVDSVKTVRVSTDLTDLSSDVSTELKIEAFNADNNQVTQVKIFPNVARVKVPIRKGKLVSVKVPTTGSISNNMVLKSVTPVNKSIEIIGDESVLNSINEISTDPINLTNIDGTKDVSVALKIPLGVRAVNNERYVKVNVLTTQYVTKDITVQVKEKNTPTGLTASFDKGIKITLRGLQEDISALKDEDLGNITAEADFTNIKEGSNTVDYTISNLPSKITVQAKNPDKLTVTAKKAAQ